jgi:ketosteroid isomerase-like protein
MDSTALASAYFDMWNSGQTARVAEIVAATWLDHAHPEVGTPEAVAQAVQAVRAARPRLWFRIDAVLGDADRVAVVGAATTTADPAAGSRLVWLFSVADGRLTQLRTFRDTAP